MAITKLLPAQLPLNSPADDEQKQELVALFDQLKQGGIRLNLVAETSGINYKTLLNKLKTLDADLKGEESNNRNRFTRLDHKVIFEWWAMYRERMLASK